MLWHWLLNVTGVHFNHGSSQWYNFWSGIGSDVGEAFIIGSIYSIYLRHKCNACFRLAHIVVAGTTYKTCRKHATIDMHRRLADKHQAKHPELHKLIKQKGDDDVRTV